MTEAIKVTLSGRTVGYLTWDWHKNLALFEYDRAFVESGLDIAPINMSTRAPRSIKGLAWWGDGEKLYRGLPPTFADSLPDKWGSTLFNKWFAQNHISAKNISPLDHLAFIGKRAMGALEYEPAIPIGNEEPQDIDILRLYNFSMKILDERESVVVDEQESFLWQDLIKISTSAGGRHPKAIVAINDTTGQVMSGQGAIPEGFRHYMLKYDDGKGFPYAKMEYAYYRIAQIAGIRMMPSQLRAFGPITHFLTERFDRAGNDKIHTQTLAAMNPAADCYEDIFSTMRKLNLPYDDFKQLYKTMVMNVLGMNVDDHNKNFAFCMDSHGTWRLAPAYDLTFSTDPTGPAYLNRHELSIAGKKGGITKQDLIEVGRRQDISNCAILYEEVESSMALFPQIAAEAGIEEPMISLFDKQLP